MSDPHSVILLPPTKGRPVRRRIVFPWKRVRSFLPIAAALALGWTIGFFQGSHQRSDPTPPVLEAEASASVPDTGALPASAPNLPEVERLPLVAKKDEVTAPVPAPVTPPSPPAKRVSAPQPKTLAPVAALPAPSVPLNGTIRIDSQPEQAQVYAAEKLLGVTPLVLDNLPAGTHTFRVEKERHTRKTVDARLKAGGQVDLSVELQYDPEPRTGGPFTNGQEVRMRWIPSLRGWAASVETTQAVYEAITHEDPSENKGPELPVTNVTWAAALKFCELLTIAERGLGFLPEGYAYTLPSDEEWSLLAAGTSLAQAVTNKDGLRQQPATVGSLAANALGLHDIRGNVWEWCRDSYTAEVHRREQVENGTGDRARINQRYKVLRGGSWTRSLETNLALGYRLAADANGHSDYETGFRVVLLPEP